MLNKSIDAKSGQNVSFSIVNPQINPYETALIGGKNISSSLLYPGTGLVEYGNGGRRHVQLLRNDPFNNVQHTVKETPIRVDRDYPYELSAMQRYFIH